MKLFASRAADVVGIGEAFVRSDKASTVLFSAQARSAIARIDHQ
jgi:hypothetical protein